MAVTASVKAGVAVSSIEELGAGTNNSITANLPSGGAPIALTAGTSAGQVDAAYVLYGTATAAAVDHDLTALTGGRGTSLTSKAKLVYVLNLEAADSGKDLTVGGGASNPFVGRLGGTSPTEAVKAGTPLIWLDRSTAGMTVDATHKVIRIDPGSQTVNYCLIVAGN